MYSVLFVAALGGGTAVSGHDQPYGTCGVTYECGCYGSAPGAGFACPACAYGGAYGGPAPGYGPVGWGAYGGPGAGYLPPPPAPFNPILPGTASRTGTLPPVPPATSPGGDAGRYEVRRGGAPDVPSPPAAGAAAKIVVDLPPDARLVVGSQNSGPAGPTRTFVTEALEPGREYTYPVWAEVVREGLTLTARKEVRLRAGQEVRLVIDFPRASASQK
jgi:uncharacterized protein (TIGR03000 family)